MQSCRVFPGFSTFPLSQFLQSEVTAPLKAVETGGIIFNENSESWSLFATNYIMRSFS